MKKIDNGSGMLSFEDTNQLFALNCRKHEHSDVSLNLVSFLLQEIQSMSLHPEHCRFLIEIER